jgi:hypothetical protein
MPAGTPADIVGIGIPEITIPGFFLGYISPNPLSGEGFLNFNASRKLNVDFSISNMNGQILMKRNINGEEGYNKVSFNATEWPSGVYFVKAQVEGKSIIRKFIVQH